MEPIPWHTLDDVGAGLYYVRLAVATVEAIVRRMIYYFFSLRLPLEEQLLVEDYCCCRLLHPLRRIL